MNARDPNGKWAVQSFPAVYDALDREMRRLGELRKSDQEAVAAALIAAKEAVSKAEVSQQRTNENQNEFRQQLKDQAATLMPRSEYMVVHDALSDRVKTLEQGSNVQTGRSEESKDNRTLLFSVLSVIIGAIAAFGYALAFVKP